jgi:hypothetical protein
MPLLIGAAVVFGAGFVVGKGVEGTSNLVKWGVIGAAGYVALKHFKG